MGSPGDQGDGRREAARQHEELLGDHADVVDRDTPADVEATFRTQRRVAVGYFLVFLIATFAAPALAVMLPWWTSARIAGGMSPFFLMAAAGLYVFFLVIASLAASLADTVEQRMLGVHETDSE